MIVIDGSYGEGGGQVLRSALTLATLLGQPVRIERIRAGRPNPGLAAQHLTGVLAMASVCSAKLNGAELGSQELTFVPRYSGQAGTYSFDVAEARRGGSAGSTSLVFQPLLLPLAAASGSSRVTITGGTHVAWSPPYHYLEYVYLPTMARLGVRASIQIKRWGWFPIGGGTITATVEGSGRLALAPLDLTQRGQLIRIHGISALSNLPKHIGQRQKQRMGEVLRARGFTPEITIVHAPAKGQGTAVFLVAEYEQAVAGFTALGARGKPAEKVAEEACRYFLAYHESGAALDMHLADQLVLPLALARGESAFTTCRITRHLLTNIWVVEHFLPVKFTIGGEEGQAGLVTVCP